MRAAELSGQFSAWCSLSACSYMRVLAVFTFFVGDTSLWSWTNTRHKQTNEEKLKRNVRPNDTQVDTYSLATMSCTIKKKQCLVQGGRTARKFYSHNAHTVAKKMGGKTVKACVIIIIFKEKKSHNYSKLKSWQANASARRCAHVYLHLPLSNF